MTYKERKNKFKKINKDIAQLKVVLKRLEIRPCKGDADLRKKDEEIKLLKLEIYQIEKDINQFSFY